VTNLKIEGDKLKIFEGLMRMAMGYKNEGISILKKNLSDEVPGPKEGE
jgi:hypothetical protein